jgi:Mg2+ and Co2+ transporter CorA
LLKYVAKRLDASKSANPWSIRHALIYQKVDLAAGESNHILVRLSETMKSQLDKSITETPRQFVRDWVELHVVCLDNIDHDMRQYINYLDEEVREVFGRMLLSGVEPEKLNEYDTASNSAKDMKTLQVLQDQAQRVSTMVSLNMETIGCLSRQAARLGTLGDSSSHWCGMLSGFESRLQDIEQQHRFSLINISAVIRRIETYAEQLRDTISIRNSELANVHTRAVVHLSKASSQETRVVKALTVLALVFVPAGFVAVSGSNPPFLPRAIPDCRFRTSSRWDM